MTDVRAGGAANDIVAIEGRGQVDRGEEVGVELRAKLAQLFEGKRVEFHAFFQSKTNGVPDLLVRGAEGYALMDEVGGRGHGVEVAGLRSFVHAGKIELERGGEARHE